MWILCSLEGLEIVPKELLPLQRHLCVLTKFAHVESRLSGRKRHREVVFYTPVNLCARRACSTSVAVGLNDQNQRVYFTPEIKGVSTSQHMSYSVIRLACYLAAVCGVSLRHIALLFSVLFLIPITKSSIKRWID